MRLQLSMRTGSANHRLTCHGVYLMRHIQLHPSHAMRATAQGPIVQQNGVAASAAGSKAALTQRIEALLKSAPILLFMKV